MKRIIIVLAILIWILAQPRAVSAPRSSLSIDVTSPGVASSPLKFAVMSDIHSDLPHLLKALAKAKEDVVSFVIITGDLTTVGTTTEFQSIKKALDGSGLKYYAVPGNHDWWGSNQAGRQIWSGVFGPDYQSFKTGAYKFILVDNANPVGMAVGEVTWLESSLTECHVFTCLVFMHEPLNHPTSEYTMGQEGTASARQASTLISEMKADGATTIYAGHLHSSSHYTLDGLTTTIVGAVTSDRNWQTPRFVEVTLGATLEEKEVVIE